MSSLRPSFRASSVLAAIVLAAGSLVSVAHAQVGTAISYQGQLKNSGEVVNTNTDMRFTLFDAAAVGNVVGGPVEILAIPVNNGLFNANPDFGFNPYTLGQDLWLLIEVRNPAGSGSYVPMGSRQKLTPAPYSLATRGIKVDDEGDVGIGGPGTFWRVTATTAANDWGFVQFNPTDSVGVGTFISSNAGYFGTYSAHPLKLFTGASSPYLDPGIMLATSGFVGIGTNNPTATLHVNGDSFFSGKVGIGTTTPGERLSVLSSDIDAARLASSNSASTRVHIQNTSTNGRDWYLAATGATAASGPGNFQVVDATAGVTRLHINTAGNVGIGTTSQTAKLDIAGSVRVRTDDLINFGGDTENSDPVWIRRQNFAADQTALEMRIGDDYGGAGTSNDAFIITAGGGVLFQFNSQSAGGFAGQALKNGGGAWGVLSDARLKHDILPLNGSLDRLMRLQGHTYFYNDPNAAGAGEGKHTGFVAQEVERTFPEWIGTTASGMKTLNITGFEALAVEALRELRAEKDAQIAELRADNAELRARLDKLEAITATLAGRAVHAK